MEMIREKMLRVEMLRVERNRGVSLLICCCLDYVRCHSRIKFKITFASRDRFPLNGKLINIVAR